MEKNWASVAGQLRAAPKKDMFLPRAFLQFSGRFFLVHHGVLMTPASESSLTGALYMKQSFQTAFPAPALNVKGL